MKSLLLWHNRSLAQARAVVRTASLVPEQEPGSEMHAISEEHTGASNRTQFLTPCPAYRR